MRWENEFILRLTTSRPTGQKEIAHTDTAGFFRIQTTEAE